MVELLEFSDHQELHRFVKLCEHFFDKTERIKDGWKCELEINSCKLYLTILDNKKTNLQPPDSHEITKAIEKINSLIRTAKIPYEHDKSPYTAHARDMLERILAILDIGNEIDRCAIVILVDAAIEFLLRARIDKIASEIGLSRLKSDEITNRFKLYKAIEEKDYVIPYKDKIIEIRTKIRNDVMHVGRIPPQETAKYCIDTLTEVLKL
ncbi:MAG: hypothetical protein GF308_21320 [Candidatus Heimdallarchaeota archaeon]|nr:hypothetical protein [Candidatus Heimdallarchaeota archaeon]